jgi:hypothetical protein
MVGVNPKQGEELKGFQETSEIPVVGSIEDARAALLAVEATPAAVPGALNFIIGSDGAARAIQSVERPKTV